MNFVPARCTQCNGILKVDPEKECAICSHCNTPFITQKAINNYITNNVTNIENFNADKLIIEDGTSLENQLKAGDTYIILKDFDYARKIFRKLSQNFPYDYRTWWGIIKTYNNDFQDFEPNIPTLSRIDQFYRKAYIVASDSDKEKIKEKYKAYIQVVTANASDKKQSLTEEYDSKKEDLENQKNELLKEKENLNFSFGTIFSVFFCCLSIISAIGIMAAYKSLLAFSLCIFALLFILMACCSISEISEKKSQSKKEVIDTQISEIDVLIENSLKEYEEKADVFIKLINLGENILYNTENSQNVAV